MPGRTPRLSMESFSLPKTRDEDISEGDQARIVLSLLQGLKEMVQEASASPGIFGKEASVIGLSSELKKQLRLAGSQISSLMEKCIGQPARPIEINRHLERVKALIGTLESPSGPALRRWRSGEIQAEIISELDSIATEVLRIQERLEGKASPYGAGDFLGRIIGGVGGIVKDLFSPALIVVKLLVLVAAIVSGVFFYFWLNMEREDDLALKITTLSAQISARQELARRFVEEISRLERAIAKIEETPSGRPERLALVELQLKAQEAREGRERISVEIAALERSLAECERRLSEIKNKGFLERLFNLNASPP